MIPAEVFRRAVTVVQQDGWHQGEDPYDVASCTAEGGAPWEYPVNLVGAIRSAAGLNPDDDATPDYARRVCSYAPDESHWPAHRAADAALTAMARHLGCDADPVHGLSTWSADHTAQEAVAELERAAASAPPAPNTDSQESPR
jgi:hypothetical protein